VALQTMVARGRGRTWSTQKQRLPPQQSATFCSNEIEITRLKR
jgi:hypothetical protein